MVAVEDFASAEGAIYEPLFVRRHAERTRAVLKIQEGCDCRCSYCVIPSVRGPIRSSPLDQIRAQAEELARAGYREVVLTGIHLSSYGRDFTPRRSLLDAIDAVHAVPGVERIRLGSLEPRVVTAEFVEALGKREKVCPQFHLSLQSGSDTILRAMRRQYSVRQYEAACALLRQSYPRVALTTDIMTGFPGEGEAEFQQTLDTVRRIRFARIHVFPYSEREGTDAATYPHAVPKAEREARARRLIALGEEQQRTYIDSMVGGGYPVLIEEAAEGLGVGYTPEYVRAHVPGGEPGEIAWIRALEAREEALWGERTEGEER